MNSAFVFRILAWSFALGLLALPVVGVLNGSFASDRWPLRSLELQAELRQVSLEQIEGVVRQHTGRGFFALSLTELRDALARLPWVQSVQVRKRWPDTVSVQVLEYQPYAIWADRAIVSRSGHLFTVPGIESLGGLPRLWGPDDRVADVVNFHARAADLLAKVPLTVTELHLLPRGSWQLVLDGGAEVALGRDRAEQRLHRFATTIGPLLRSHPATPLQRADLRYPNGYALVWADGSTGGEPPARSNSQHVRPAATAGQAQEPQA